MLDLLCYEKYIESTIVFVAQKRISKLGRPKLPKGEARTETIRARVTKEEREVIEAVAKAEGKDVSEWMRGLILQRVVVAG
jgi:hypothetical protein